MSDQSTESTDAAQDAGESTFSETHGPDGQPWDGPRLMRALQSERQQSADRQKRIEEIQSDAERFRALQSDEDARLEQLRSWGFEVEDGATDEQDDDLSGYEDDTQPDPRVDQLQNQLNGLLQRQAIDEFNKDLDAAATEADIKLSQRDRVIIQRDSMENGFNPDATRKAVDALKAEREELRKQAIEEYRSSKKAPHISSVGKGATQAPDLDDPQARVEWMTRRLLDAEQQ